LKLKSSSDLLVENPAARAERPVVMPQTAKLGIHTGLFRLRGCVLECCPLDLCRPHIGGSVIVWPLPQHRRWVPASHPSKAIRTVSRSARTQRSVPVACVFTEQLLEVVSGTYGPTRSAGFDRDDVGTDSTRLQGRDDACSGIPGERWSSRTSMSSRVPAASPLTGREPAQSASCPMVTPPDSRPLAGAARLGPEELQSGWTGWPLLATIRGCLAATALEHHDLRRPQGHPDFPAVEPGRDWILHHPPGLRLRPRLASPRLASAMRLETRTNDLLRVCSPGGTDLSIRTIDHLGAVEDELNNRLSPSSLTAHQPSCSKRF
jgi:hypothetical protein